MEATLELAAIREALDEPVFKFAVCVPSERDSQKVIRFLTLVSMCRPHLYSPHVPLQFVRLGSVHCHSSPTALVCLLAYGSGACW
jgi:hypothetical protein